MEQKFCLFFSVDECRLQLQQFTIFFWLPHAVNTVNVYCDAKKWRCSTCKICYRQNEKAMNGKSSASWIINFICSGTVGEDGVQVELSEWKIILRACFTSVEAGLHVIFFHVYRDDAGEKLCGKLFMPQLDYFLYPSTEKYLWAFQRLFNPFRELAFHSVAIALLITLLTHANAPFFSYIKF